MKFAFLLSGIIELAGGIVLYLYPHFLFASEITLVSQLYGIAIIIIGIISLSCYYHYSSDRLLTIIFLAFMAYHGAVSMFCYSADPVIFPLHIYATIVHVSIFTIFTLGYLHDIKPNKKVH